MAYFTVQYNTKQPGPLAGGAIAELIEENNRQLEIFLAF